MSDATTDTPLDLSRYEVKSDAPWHEFQRQYDNLREDAPLLLAECKRLALENADLKKRLAEVTNNA